MLRVDFDRFGVVHYRLVDFPLCAMREASMVEGVGISWVISMALVKSAIARSWSPLASKTFPRFKKELG